MPKVRYYKICSGSYRTTTGYLVERSFDDTKSSGRGDEWHVFSLLGEYCQTYATRKDALKVLGEA